MEKIILVYLGCVTVFTFFLYVLDKLLAIGGKRRIPEATLLGCTMLGGAVGGLIAMYLVRHKTRRWYFRVANICFAIVYAVVAVWLAVA